MDPARQLGFLSSAGLALVGTAYLVVVLLAVAEVGLEDPVVDPALAVMEILTLLAALLLVVVMASVHAIAAQARKVFGLLALSFAVIMAGLTSAVHFVALTAGRQPGPFVLEWPSIGYALELLAWDVFLGMSLLCAAAVFPGPGFHAAARWALGTTGVLCLVGTVGPVLGDMTLQRIGILGYGVGLPVSSLLLAVVFRRRRSDPGVA
ncbi:hypothetical protein [Thioalkalivibrio sp. XN8]|uniref:hypothetical protein n=1 Tax=Thioalkalivibrio sp. XN8 TaxID=2712863 RepID=UPI0013E9D0F7|nr:hypothetical protein [Thioalkalivibrio sp. XN8]NGP53523.1 hypothetical protein [Thioalkalivibrio sp. XN8]